MLEKVTNSDTSIGIIGYVCIEQPPPPIPPPVAPPQVPVPPRPTVPPPAPPKPPPSKLVVQYVKDYNGECWKIMYWDPPSVESLFFGDPIQKIPINCTGMP